MLTTTDVDQALRAMTGAQQARFLCILGHTLTVVARSAYEFQGPGVTNPRLLRDLNEIHHRIYPQIQSLLGTGEPAFDTETLASWLAGEERSAELQNVCRWAFEESVRRMNA
jgi:hypothetical protein